MPHLTEGRRFEPSPVVNAHYSSPAWTAFSADLDFAALRRDYRARDRPSPCGRTERDAGPMSATFGELGRF